MEKCFKSCVKLMLIKDGNYMCDNCEKVFLLQPERSKREDHHLTLDDFSDNPTTEQLGEEMRKREREILDAVL